MADYKCVECEEMFERIVECVSHNIDSKHEKFALVGTDVVTNIVTKGIDKYIGKKWDGY